jgi:uncharacterized protein YcaQ
MHRVVTPQHARQLAITRQQLAGTPPPATKESILDIVRAITCLQLDPTNVVARNQYLILWSRLGNYARELLDEMLWQDRSLFEYWAHVASIVLTEDFPIFADRMGAHLDGDSDWSQGSRDWMQANEELRLHILEELQQRGPLASKDFEDKSTTAWWSSGWTNDRTVTRMLDFLWARGDILVSKRQGQSRFWDLAERCLPDWTPRTQLTRREVVRQGAARAIRALGISREKHIRWHFIRGRYDDLTNVLNELTAEGILLPMQVKDNSTAWPGTWYLHRDDLPLLERIEGGAFEPRTTLLSPFDNLICDRAYTELAFDFYFRIEIYVPKPKRQYGYFVLPILHGDQLIGRIDPQLDRKTGTFVIHNVYAEPTAPVNTRTGKAVAAAIADLARFAGADRIDYAGQIPEGWKKSLRSG